MENTSSLKFAGMFFKNIAHFVLGTHLAEIWPVFYVLRLAKMPTQHFFTKFDLHSTIMFELYLKMSEIDANMENLCLFCLFV